MLDVTVFLLVIGVAVATLVSVPMPTDEDGTDRADAIAEDLATGTERVEYSLAPAARALDGDPPVDITDGPRYTRSAHGTVASLLADAAVATMTVDGERISPDGEAFESAVATATEQRTNRENVSVQVRALWRPYPDASIQGEVVAGATPPPTASVNAASVTVDGPMPESRQDAIDAAATDGYRGVASAVANATVDGILPPKRTRYALRGDYPVDALVAARYVGMSHAVGGEHGRPTAQDDVEQRNAALADAMAARLEDDLRDRFDTPAAAARNVSTGRVTVTVRTWSR